MAWDEIKGDGGNSEDFEEREKLSTKIGSEIVGTVVKVGQKRDGQYGEVRWVDIDTRDGVEATFPARKILLERVEKAELRPGDRIKVVVETGEGKNGGRDYALPRVYVDRGDGRTATKEPAKKAALKSKPAPAPVEDDEPDF